MENCKTTSKYHPGRQCGPCFLCGGKAHYYSHFESWSAKEKEFVSIHHGNLQEGANTCICKSDYIEVKRHHSDENYIPKWKQNTSSKNCSKKYCSVSGCKLSTDNSKIITPGPDLQTAIWGDKYVDQKLCMPHYSEFYKKENGPKPCKSCGAFPKCGTTFTRHCPNPVVVNAYNASHNEELPDHRLLQKQDYICLECYMLHIEIVNITMSENLSRDSDLESMIEDWRKEVERDPSDKLKFATVTTVLYVAERLLINKAMLLPRVCNYFISELNSTQSGDESPDIETPESCIKFSSRWLLHKLVQHLKHHLSYKCIHRKYGTLLYRTGSDLLTSISWALGEKTTPTHSSMVGQDHAANKQGILNEAGYVLNDLLHTEVERLKNTEHDPAKLDIDDYMKGLDDRLCSFIETITKSVRYRSGAKSNSEASNTKKMRRFFILCQLLFCTNPSCATPMHYLLADAIEIYGGSRQLQQIFNKLGVVVASDVYDKFVSSKSLLQKEQSMWEQLDPEIFTLATVDNWDKQSRHALVRCGSKSRSYHATTLMSAQPDPSLTIEPCKDNSATTPEERPPPTKKRRTSDEVAADEQSLPAGTKRRVTDQECPPHAKRMRMLEDIGQQQVPPDEVTATSVGTSGTEPATSDEQVPRAATTCTTTQPPDEDSQPPTTSVGTSGQQPALPPTRKKNPYEDLTIQDFVESKVEAKEKAQLKEGVLSYFTLKYLDKSKTPHKRVKDFLTSHHKPKTSRIYYMDLIDECADSDETLMSIAEQLLQEFGSKKQYTILVGDGKTYQHLAKIKKMYNTALKNLLIFPGDWHTLKNYQPVLMKIYYHCGLKELAKVAGFKAETLTSLPNCSHFKRTHHFLVQVWEALYLEMLRAFNTADTTTLTVLSERMCQVITQDVNLEEMLAKVKKIIEETRASTSFMAFVDKRAEQDDTWKLWKQFVFVDCMAYMSLYLGIRSSNWNLRMSGLKLMAPLFTAYDRPCYSKIIPHHFAEYQNFPQQVKDCFKSGGFTISVCGNSGQSIALDEGHEMLINKDLKAAVVRPSSAYLQKTVHYIRYRIEAYGNMLKQLYPKGSNAEEKTSIYDTSSVTRVYNENITTMRQKIMSESLLPTETHTNRGVLNVFTGVPATPAQTKDLLSARKTGKEQYINYVEYNILQKPSTTDAPIRKHRLLTMADPATKSTRKMSTKEKEQKRIEKCLRRRLSWCNQEGNSYKTGLEQYSIYPRAIADSEGTPHRGSKAKWTEKLFKRYPELSSCNEPTLYNAVVYDFIFLLQTAPSKGQTINGYSQMLMRRHILPHYANGTTEVHTHF